MGERSLEKRAIVVGCAGQDGSLLFDLLTERGYQLVGLARDAVRVSGIAWIRPVDLGSADEVAALVRAVSPCEIYYLAAFHHSAEDAPIGQGQLFAESNRINVTGLFHYLESIRLHAPAARLFYAASSHVFGEPDTPSQDESTPLRPNSIYAMTKAYGMQLCRYYRSVFTVYAATGILYNHESPRRGLQFLSRKVVSSALKIKRGELDKLVVGSLSVRADWGYAPEYVDAMTRVLGLPDGDDFIIASGVSHSVQDFVAAVFAALDLDWREYTMENPGLLARKSLPLIGNPRKLEQATGWRANVGLTEMVTCLIDAEQQLLLAAENKK